MKTFDNYQIIKALRLKREFMVLNQEKQAKGQDKLVENAKKIGVVAEKITIKVFWYGLIVIGAMALIEQLIETAELF